jgi:hypothetical protein
MSPVFLAGVVEEVIARVIKKSASDAVDAGAKRITAPSIALAIASDVDLARIFSSFSFPSAGSALGGSTYLDHILPADEAKRRQEKKKDALRVRKEKKLAATSAATA